jgi:hypothetical protein
MLQIDMDTCIWLLRLSQKKLNDLDEDEVISFTNGLMSHVVSYNSTQSLRFKNHISFVELVWTSNWNITLFWTLI